MPRTKIDTRERILAAALAIFSERGFAAATTRQIADLAEVNQPLIAYYFASKEELWKAAIDLTFSKFDKALDDLIGTSTDVAAQPAAVVRAFVGCVADNPEWVAFMCRIGMQTDTRIAWLTERWIRPQTAKTYRLLTGERIDTACDHQLMRAMTLTWMMAGPTAIFAQGEQLKALAGVDVASPHFIETYAELIVTSVQSVLPLIGAISFAEAASE